MISTLTGEFLTKAEELIFECEQQGVIMRPFFAIRTPLQQARLWRQSRAVGEINRQISRLEKNGCRFLADCIKKAGPQFGLWATNALPGLSWHQFGEALDCFWLVDGDACWDTSNKANGANGYRVYAKTAERLGLTCLGPVIGDWVHVQLRKGTPASVYSLAEIDAMMQERYRE